MTLPQTPTRINVRSLFRMTVSMAVVEDDQILMVREGKGSDRKQWNLPGGKSRKGEDLIDAAIRETQEETGYDVKVRGLVGVYCYDTATVQRMRLVFAADVVGGEPTYDGEEILDVRWFPFSQLSKMPAKRLSRVAMLRPILKDIKSGQFSPTELVRYLRFEQVSA